MTRHCIFFALLSLSTAACGDDNGSEDAATADAPASDVAGDTAVGDDAVTADVMEDAGAAPECVLDSDCRLASDCCTCQAAPVGAMVPECDAACVQTVCEAAGIEEVECKAGVCVIANADCDTTPVTCELAPPECGAGMTAHVVGDCYSGLCVPVEACQFVAECADCATDQTCVTFETMLGPRDTCAPTPASCGDTPDCACLGDEICEEPFLCSEGASLSCYCPTC